MTKLLYIAAIFLFGMIAMSSGCHTPTSSGPPALKKTPSLSDTGLSGTSWNWIYTWVPSYLNPGNTGLSVKLEFERDSIFNFYRNDTLIETAQYHVFLDTNHLDGPWLISFPNSTKFYGQGYDSLNIIYLRHDTLIILPIVADARSSYYKQG